MVVATMGLSQYQFPVLKALNLYDFFEGFLTPDRTGYLKMHPEFYQQYIDYPNRIHIGDRYDHDCWYPHQFGAKTILRLPLDELRDQSPFKRPALLSSLNVPLVPPKPELLPDAVIVHLAELPNVITQLLAAS
jgi:FMN phosphatase YigB (HAD superfamily)